MIDFEAEGLLEGVDGDARRDRQRLLEQLAADGVPLEELRDAVAAGRLKGNETLPAKMVLTVGGLNLSHTVDGPIELE